MIDWLRRRFIVVTPEKLGGGRDWSSGFLHLGDCIELWWTPGHRGVRVWWWRFQASVARNGVYLALTDHSTYIDVIWKKEKKS